MKIWVSAALVALFLSGIFSQGCNFLEQPAVTNEASKVAKFSHAIVAEQSCSSCHETLRPAPVAGVPHGQSADCAICHRIGPSWKALQNFTHKPLPSSCVLCHEVNRPKPEHFGKQDCFSCHEAGQNQDVGFRFTHKNFELRSIATCLPCHESRRKSPDHFAGQDCASCHLDSTRSWAQSTSSPHPQNNPVPVNCNGCHERDRPQVTQKQPGHFGADDCILCHESRTVEGGKFVYTHSANQNSLKSCLPCHADKRPEAMIGRFTHQVFGAGDCFKCHQDSKVWSGGVFKHDPAPVQSCLPCHEANRPPAVTHGFSHQKAGDCLSCHQFNQPWSRTVYVHPRGLSECASCHEARRPVSSHYGSVDCLGCHLEVGKSWKAVSPHPAQNSTLKTCSNCHEQKRPDKTIFPTVNPSAPKPTVLSHFGDKDCNLCHVSKNSGVSNWKFQHSAGGTLEASCFPCHNTGAPIGVVKRFDHETFGSGDCIGCHKKAAPNWSGAVFGHNPAPKRNCGECHEVERPTKLGEHHFSHAKAGDCLFCHQNSKPWKKGYYQHGVGSIGGCDRCH